MRKAGDRNIGFASSYDLRRTWYHPQLKIPAAERLARWALATQYGFEEEILWEPPAIDDVEIADGMLVLHMNMDVGAVTDGSDMCGFAIAGHDGNFQPAYVDYLVTGNDRRGRPQKDSSVLVLSSPLVSNPIHFRYAWARNPMGNIQRRGHTDIPLPTQRSDTWGMFGPDPETDKEGNPKSLKQLISELKEADLKRRLYEARKLLEHHASSER
jgi:sialate O-acetylesterase